MNCRRILNCHKTHCHIYKEWVHIAGFQIREFPVKFFRGPPEPQETWPVQVQIHVSSNRYRFGPIQLLWVPGLSVFKITPLRSKSADHYRGAVCNKVSGPA